MQREHSTGHSEEESENFYVNHLDHFSRHVLINESTNDSFQPNLDVNLLSVDDPSDDTNAKCNSVSKIDAVGTETCLVSQCTDEVPDDNDSEDTLEGTQEDAGRPTKTVFILHFDDTTNIDETNPILVLAKCLREYHVDVILDMFECDNPPSSWPMWYEENIRESDVVLCIITEHFYHKLTRGNHVIGQSVYNLMNDSDTAFRAVFLNTPKHMENVPTSMRGSTCYCLSSLQLTFENKEFASLYAFLTGQNRIDKPELGEMVVLPYSSGLQKRQEDIEFGPYTRDQLDTIYAANADLLESSSQDSVHMFGSEGGREADADTDVGIYGLSSSDSSDDELVAGRKTVYHISRPDSSLKDLMRESGLPEQMLSQAAGPPNLSHLNKDQQSNIMQFPETMYSDTRPRLSKSQSSSGGLYPFSKQWSELTLPPNRDTPVPQMKLKLATSPHESRNFDLSETECLIYPTGVTCVSQSQASLPSSIVSVPRHLGIQCSTSVRNMHYHNHMSNQFDIHDGSQRSSFGALYPLSCSSSQSEFTFPHLSELSPSMRPSELDSQSSGLDSWEHTPPNCTMPTQSFEQTSMPTVDMTSSREYSQCLSSQKPNLHFPDHAVADCHYDNRAHTKALCSYCQSVLVCPRKCDFQISAVAPACKPKEMCLNGVSSSFGPAEFQESDSNNSDSDSSQCPLLSSPVPSQPTLLTTHNSTIPKIHVPRKRKWKCVVM